MARSLTLLVLAALSLAGWSALRKRQRQRLAATPKAKPEALQAWEGEGGGLPNGGPGPTIATATAASEAAPTEPTEGGSKRETT